jgi:hypothetical protein
MTRRGNGKAVRMGLYVHERSFGKLLCADKVGAGRHQGFSVGVVNAVIINAGIIKFVSKIKQNGEGI